PWGPAACAPSRCTVRHVREAKRGGPFVRLSSTIDRGSGRVGAARDLDPPGPGRTEPHARTTAHTRATEHPGPPRATPRPPATRAQRERAGPACLEAGGTMEQTINRGLDGVYIDESAICFIDGGKGQLVYRGYDIRELAGKASFEEVAYLLWRGELPDRAQLDAFRARLAPYFRVPPAVYDLYRSLPAGTSPMAALRSAVSLLAGFDEQPDGVDEANVHRIGTQLLAQFPLLVAAFQRIRAGQEPVEPRPDLSVAANFLYTLTGEEPSPAATRVMDVALVLHAEHGSNASTFV